MEADILEAAACGDRKTIGNILAEDSSLVNFQHSMNGWTALHWAAKRGHAGVARLLIEKGANKSLRTSDGKEPVDLATQGDLLQILNGNTDSEQESFEKSTHQEESNKTIFEPSYLKYPPPPTYYARDTSAKSNQSVPDKQPVLTNYTVEIKTCDECLGTIEGNEEDELVLKVRRAGEQDTDFIEVELNMKNRTMDHLISILCSELEISKDRIIKVRKLPNTIIRKDKDVKRLTDFQELEVVINQHL